MSTSPTPTPTPILCAHLCTSPQSLTAPSLPLPSANYLRTLTSHPEYTLLTFHSQLTRLASSHHPHTYNAICFDIEGTSLLHAFEPRIRDPGYNAQLARVVRDMAYRTWMGVHRHGTSWEEGEGEGMQGAYAARRELVRELEEVNAARWRGGGRKLRGLVRGVESGFERFLFELGEVGRVRGVMDEVWAGEVQEMGAVGEGWRDRDELGRRFGELEAVGGLMNEVWEEEVEALVGEWVEWRDGVEWAFEKLWRDVGGLVGEDVVLGEGMLEEDDVLGEGILEEDEIIVGIERGLWEEIGQCQKDGEDGVVPVSRRFTI